MSITLDPTVGGANANSYASVAEADAQAAATVGPSAAAWVAEEDEETKKQALITATRDIDTLDFIGEKADEDQALEWPRARARKPTGSYYDSGALPPRLVAATIELAIDYLANATSDVLNPVVNDKKSVAVDDVKVEFFEPGDTEPNSLSRFPAMVERYLLSLVVTVPVPGGWGSGRVVRAS